MKDRRERITTSSHSTLPLSQVASVPPPYPLSPPRCSTLLPFIFISVWLRLAPVRPVSLRFAPFCPAIPSSPSVSLLFVPSCSASPNYAPLCSVLLRSASSPSVVLRFAPLSSFLLRFVPFCSVSSRVDPFCSVLLRFAPFCSASKCFVPLCSFSSFLLRFAPLCPFSFRPSPICSMSLYFAPFCSVLLRFPPRCSVCSVLLSFAPFRAVSFFALRFAPFLPPRFASCHFASLLLEFARFRPVSHHFAPLRSDSRRFTSFNSELFLRRITASGAIHILSRILHTDPAKRADVSEIRRNAWYVGAHPPAGRPKATPFPAVPSRRSHIDDKLLSRAITLTGPGGGGNGAGGGGGGSEGEVSMPKVEGAAAGLLSGRHDPVGTAYHLLLKRTLRERSAIEASAGGGGRCRSNREADRHQGEATRQAARAAPDTAAAESVVATAQASSATQGVEDRRGRSSSEEHRGEREVVGNRNENASASQRGGDQAGQPTPQVAATKAAPKITVVAAAAAAETVGKQQTPSAGPRAPGATTTRIIHGNASYASSTSSSRSGQQQPFSTAAARRRDRSGGGKAAEAATAAAGGSGDSPSHGGPKARSQQQQARPQTPAANSNPICSVAATGAPVQAPVQARTEGGVQGGRQADATKDGDGTRVAALVEKYAKGAGEDVGGVGGDWRGRDARGTEGHRGGARAGQAIRPNRPVPTLSFRGISRTGGAESIVGGHGGKATRPSSSAAFFVSQTARARTNGDSTAESRVSTDRDPARQRPAGHLATAHPRGSSRESGGGSSSSSSGGSAGGGWNTTAAGGGGGGGGVAALPRRPLTARAPLRSSAPTPRLSGDFSLARPRGSPAAAHGRGAEDGSSAIAATGKTVPRGGNGRMSVGEAPLAAEPLAPAAARRASLTSTTAGVGSAIRARQQQPSLRVRLSNLSSKPAVSQQQQQRRLEPSARKGEGAERKEAVSEITVKRSDADSPLQSTPTCPPFPVSTPAAATAIATATAAVAAAAASSSAPKEGAAAARTFWGKHQYAHSPTGDGRDDGRGSGRGLPPGVVATRAPPHASTSAVKSWARGDGRAAGGYPRALQT